MTKPAAADEAKLLRRLEKRKRKEAKREAKRAEKKRLRESSLEDTEECETETERQVTETEATEVETPSPSTTTPNNLSLTVEEEDNILTAFRTTFAPKTTKTYIYKETKAHVSQMITQIISYARVILARSRRQSYATISPEQLADVFGSRWLNNQQLQRIRLETGLTPVVGRCMPQERQLLADKLQEFSQEKGLTEEEIASLFYNHEGHRHPQHRQLVSEFILRTTRAFGGRTCMAVYLMYKRILHPLHRGSWTGEADLRLLQLHARYGRRWTEIGRILGRSSYSCRDRYRILLDASNENIAEGPWTPEELFTMEAAIREYQEMGAATRAIPISWLFVAERVGTRTPGQCVEKWMGILGNLLKEPRGRRGSDPHGWNDSERFVMCRGLLEGGWQSEEEVDWQGVQQFCLNPPKYTVQSLSVNAFSMHRTPAELHRQWRLLKGLCGEGSNFESTLFGALSMLRFQQTVQGTLDSLASGLEEEAVRREMELTPGMKRSFVKKALIKQFTTEMAAAEVESIKVEDVEVEGVEGVKGVGNDAVSDNEKDPMYPETYTEDHLKVKDPKPSKKRIKKLKPTPVAEAVPTNLSKEFISDSDSD